MRLIALDTHKALRDMIKVFHYGYIDEVTVTHIQSILHEAIHDDLGYYLDVQQEFFNRLMAQVIRESLTNYVDALLKAVVHNQVHTIFDAMNSRAQLSDHLHLKVYDSGSLIPMFNSVRPDLAFFLDTDHVMYKSIATVLDRVNRQNQRNLQLKTIEFISQIQPQLASEQINHVIRTDLLDATTVAMMVN